MERARALGLPAALVLVDADHFKALNDRHGHLAGDRLLQAVSGVIAAALRPGDLAARYGGDEFALMLANADVSTAMSIADSLRRDVAAAMLAGADGSPLGGVTVSIGLRILEPDDTLESLLAGADAALYRAKQSGRNRVSA
jgi:diguanylate cyclase (GGDEF)-like protein